jgi:thiol-disulfide isomerase/thioredoxin
MTTKITLYYADWCGYCTRFMPIWTQFVEKIKSEKLNIKPIAIEDTKITGLDRDLVKGFPTIIIERDGNKTVFDAERTLENLLAATTNIKKQVAGANYININNINRVGQNIITGTIYPTKVILYHADWCGHCQTFKPEWQKFKQIITTNNLPITVMDFEQKKIPPTQMANITGFPTIIIHRGGKQEEYKDERTSDGLLRACQQIQKGGNYSQQIRVNRVSSNNSKFSTELNLKYKRKYLKYKSKYINIKHQNK